MRKAAWITLATMLPALLVAACAGNGDTGAAAERQAITGSFVGTVAGSDAYVAIVVGADGDALAYVTDGAGSVDWVNGRLTHRTAKLSNEGGATLDAKFRRDTVTGSFTRPRSPALQFTARRDDVPSGLYRATQDLADGRYVGGWIVLPDGTERGAVRRYETPLAPGEVDPSTFRPGDATFTVPGGALRPELVRPSSNLALPS
jgi:hypothetical protein